MKRLWVGVSMAGLMATLNCDAKVGKLNGGTCSTTIELHVNNKGLSVPDPPRLVCAPDDPINVIFVNNDNQAHTFELLDIGCEGDKATKHDPSNELVGHKTKVEPGERKPMDGTARMKKKDDIKDQKWNGTAPYLYSYSVRVSGMAKDKDPDLEVSPPPSIK